MIFLAIELNGTDKTRITTDEVAGNNKYRFIT